MDQLTLYYNADDSNVIFVGTPENRGIDEVLKRSEALKRAGVRIVNTANMNDEERSKLYIDTSAWPAAKEHYRVAVCFGRAGRDFGRGVPAFSVRGDDGLPKDVYPHENKEMPGQFITISDYFLHHGGLPQ